MDARGAREAKGSGQSKLTDDIRLPFKLGEKLKLRAARGSGFTATRQRVSHLVTGKVKFNSMQ